MKAGKAQRRFGRAAPARDVEAERLQFGRRVAPELADPEQADADVARRRLVLVLGPDLLLLLTIVAPELPMVQQDLQDHPFAHPRGEVGIDHAHDGRIGQARVLQHVIDAGAEREDRLQVRQINQLAGPVAPAQRVADL